MDVREREKRWRDVRQSAVSVSSQRPMSCLVAAGADAQNVRNRPPTTARHDLLVSTDNRQLPTTNDQLQPPASLSNLTCARCHW